MENITKKQLGDMILITHTPGTEYQKVQDIYDGWSTYYDQSLLKYVNWKGPKVVADKVKAVFGSRADANILDLGAGTGMLSIKLRENGFSHIDALDPNKRMLEVAQKSNLYQNYFCDKLGPNHLSIENDAYDCLVLSGVFIPNHANQSCFEEVKRIMKPGGFFVFVIGEKHLMTPEFEDFEPSIARLEADGSWRLVSKEVIPEFVHYDGKDHTGLLFTIQKTSGGEE